MPRSFLPRGERSQAYKGKSRTKMSVFFAIYLNAKTNKMNTTQSNK